MSETFEKFLLKTFLSCVYLNVAGKQKIGFIDSVFPVMCIKKSYFFIYNIAMALLYTFPS